MIQFNYLRETLTANPKLPFPVNNSYVRVCACVCVRVFVHACTPACVRDH